MVFVLVMTARGDYSPSNTSAVPHCRPGEFLTKGQRGRSLSVPHTAPNEIFVEYNSTFVKKK